MKTEKEINTLIVNTRLRYKHVLDCGPATIEVNAPRGLMQIEATTMLNTLYWVVGTKRPRFTCDDYNKQDK